MRLLSSAFADRSAIPQRFTCDGGNLSPPLQWSDAPEETCSFVLLCDDPDAPGGTWHHWAVYDIPPDQSGLVDNAAQKARLKQATNDSGRLAMGDHVHRPDTASTIIAFGSLPSRRIIFVSRRMHPASTSNARRASSPLPKPLSSARITDKNAAGICS